MRTTLARRRFRVFGHLLTGIEKVGNKLPHPFMLFVYIGLVIALISWVVSWFGVRVADPESGELVAVRSLVSGEGLVYALTSMLENFVSFPPLGLVIVMMFGIGLAQRVGLLSTLFSRAILSAPRRLVTAAVVLIGICSNVASEAAMIVVPPLAAVVFLAVGRHPIAGLAAAFGAVGAGFTANFVIAGTDVLLSGISTEAAAIVDGRHTVSPLSNWYFMSASTVLLTVVGVVITEKVVEPRLGEYSGPTEEAPDKEVSPEQRRGLRYAGLTAAGFIAAVAVLSILPGAPLRGDGSFLDSPLLQAIVPLLFMLFVLTGSAYGVAVGEVRSANDLPKIMIESVRDIGGFLLMVFAAAQAIAWFNWSKLGLLLAVAGSDLMKAAGVSGLTGLLLFSVATVLFSLILSSGSALWAIEAPVFIPMFVLHDVNPAFVQVAYRIADSSTNMLAPLSPALAVAMGFLQKYKKDAGIGTLFALMVPYAVAFYLVWVVFFVAWTLLGLPVGPGESLYLNR
ncbi:AbgT family transporter [Saccharopolyspora erythraea]|uniref:AbgT family transporter n=1 Tax=Saccharopolyspora erythraea TaxID=1836 RepID=UPI001BA45347|nr:AbgT family transporter [Saccharopolyspora erythraea]QUH02048.1 AbgT family transporter [Saccharopolyspora erythraea]